MILRFLSLVFIVHHQIKANEIQQNDGNDARAITRNDSPKWPRDTPIVFNDDHEYGTGWNSGNLTTDDSCKYTEQE